MNEQVEFKKTFATLTSLKQNLPTNRSVDMKYIEMYHEELDRLLTLGIDHLEDFRIPSAQMKSEFVGGNYVTGEMNYSSDKYVEREFFMTKLDAVLSFFQLNENENTIGFKLQ